MKKIALTITALLFAIPAFAKGDDGYTDNYAFGKPCFVTFENDGDVYDFNINLIASVLVSDNKMVVYVGRDVNQYSYDSKNEAMNARNQLFQKIREARKNCYSN